MTPEQVTSILTIVGSMITTIGTITIAIYSLWSQQQQELRRAAQQREWQEKDQQVRRAAEIEDRNLRRKWNMSDRQIEQRREYLVAKKAIIEAHTQQLLRFASLAAQDEPL